MNWKSVQPDRDDFETLEEYEEAMERYYEAIEDAYEELRERGM